MTRILFCLSIAAAILFSGPLQAYQIEQKILIGDGNNIICEEVSAGTLECKFVVGLAYTSDTFPESMVAEESGLSRYMFVTDGAGEVVKVVGGLDCEATTDEVICDIPLNQFFDGSNGLLDASEGYSANIVFVKTTSVYKVSFYTDDIMLSDIALTVMPEAKVDSDHDKISDDVDNCKDMYNPDQKDGDGDGFGDWCDNCMFKANPDHADNDEDGFGDACTIDADGDGIKDVEDNCATVANPGQEDKNEDGRGDACQQGIDTNENEPPVEANNSLKNFGNSGSCSLASAGATDASGLILLLQALDLGTMAVVRFKRS